MPDNQSPPLDPKVLAARITEYLSLGGLFNPEMANHDAVRDLLIDCRAALSSPEQGSEAVSVPPEAGRRSKAENLLLGLHKIVADLAPYFDKPLTDDTIPRWLALDSAQKAIAEYFEEEEEGEELSNPDHDPAVFKHAGTDGRSYYDV